MVFMCIISMLFKGIANGEKHKAKLNSIQNSNNSKLDKIKLNIVIMNYVLIMLYKCNLTFVGTE